jgi:hypothetical protein
MEINGRLLLQWALGLLLLWAALSKIGNPQEFFGQVMAYRLPLPVILSRAAAIVLPWLELLCGLSLLANWKTGGALAWATFLFGIFALATAQAWWRGLHIDCGCFDFRLVGLDPHGEMARLFQSIGLACLRALVLMACAVYLFRPQVKSL